LDFLSNNVAKQAAFQTLVFTFLNEAQVQKLRDAGTTVVTLEGHLLRPAPKVLAEEADPKIAAIKGDDNAP
jgi:hypothetical protein